jgi:hypothetical protein
MSLIIAAVTAFAACSPAEGGAATGSATDSAPLTVVAPSEITAAIASEIEIPGAAEKDISSLSLFYDIDEDLVEDFSLIISGGGAYPDEIAVFLLRDAAGIPAAEAAVQKRYKTQSDLFRDYTPNEMYKLDGANIGSKGKYVYFTACSDNARAAKIVNDMVP